MARTTIDFLPEELLIVKTALIELIERERTAPSSTPQEAQQHRIRIEIAARIRGKLPTLIEIRGDDLPDDYEV